MNWSKIKPAEYVFFGIMLLSLILFFTEAHPLVVYDGDDWSHISYRRAAIPQWEGWNPIKVFPETLLAMSGYMAAYVVRPLTQDYIFSITLTCAFVVSAFITVYFIMFYRIAREKLECDLYTGLSAVTAIFVLHFLIFRSGVGTSTFIFYSNNLTCYYHYVLTAVFNAIMVMYLYLNDNFRNVTMTGFKAGWVIFAVYLAIFSNLFSSIILASYVILLLLHRFLKQGRGIGLRRFFRENKMFSWMLLVWMISLLFESSGGRASGFHASLLELPIAETLAAFGRKMAIMNRVFLGYVVLSLIMLWRLYKTKKLQEAGHNEIFAFSLQNIAVIFTYIVLLSSRTLSSYIESDAVIFVIFFYFFFMLFYITASYLKSFPGTKKALPVLLFILVLTLFDVRYYKPSTTGYVDPRKCVEIDNNLIAQIQAAEAEGKKEMDLLVPKGDDRGNWPHPYYFGDDICKTLRSHGIINSYIKINIKPDPSMNPK